MLFEHGVIELESAVRILRTEVRHVHGLHGTVLRLETYESIGVAAARAALAVEAPVGHGAGTGVDDGASCRQASDRDGVHVAGGEVDIVVGDDGLHGVGWSLYDGEERRKKELFLRKSRIISMRRLSMQRCG